MTPTDRSQSPFTLNIYDLLAFVVFALIASPPNYIWQTWLEATFPGYAKSLSHLEKEALVDEVVAGRSTGMDTADVTLRARSEKESTAATGTSATTASSKMKLRPRLNIRNTVYKFLLDQTVGAAVNTVLFIVGIALLQGRGLTTGLRECQEKFWPLIRAGHRLWPMVSIINLTMVPVEHRMLFGSIIGVGWGIFLSIFSSSKAKTE